MAGRAEELIERLQDVLANTQMLEGVFEGNRHDLEGISDSLEEIGTTTYLRGVQDLIVDAEQAYGYCIDDLEVLRDHVLAQQELISASM